MPSLKKRSIRIRINVSGIGKEEVWGGRRTKKSCRKDSRKNRGAVNWV